MLKRNFLKRKKMTEKVAKFTAQISNLDIPFSEFQCNAVVKKISDYDIRSRIVLMQTIIDNKNNDNIIFMTNDHHVYAFGSNTHGCLGVGHCNSLWEEPILLEIFSNKKIIQIASGLMFTIVLCISKECYSFGINNFGQLGQGKEPQLVNKILNPQQMNLQDIFKLTDIISVSCGESFAAILSSDGDVYTFGSNLYGQLGHNFFPTGDEFSMYCYDAYRVVETEFVTQIVCGANHLVMLGINGKTVYLCGDNRWGQLGLSSKYQIICRPFHMTFTRRKVLSIACGAKHTMFLTFPGLIFAFGCNTEGQLGSKTTNREFNHVPKKIEICALFDQIYSHSLSNFSVAHAPQERRIYVWGEMSLSGDGREITKFDEPKRTFLESPAKAFALFEVKNLIPTFSDNDNFYKARKNYGREFKPLDRKANIGLIFENGCFWVDKTILVMFTEYYSRKYIFDTNNDMIDMIYINEYTPQALLCFLNYIYTGKLFNRTNIDKCNSYDLIELLVEICHIANDFNENILKEILLMMLTKNEFSIINPKNAFFIVQLAYKFEIYELIDKVCEYISFDWNKNPDFIKNIVKYSDEKDIVEFFQKNFPTNESLFF